MNVVLLGLGQQGRAALYDPIRFSRFEQIIAVDYRDLETGFMSMNRTVGFTASIGAQMLHHGTIRKRGLLSPLADVPYDAFVSELAQRDIHITCREQQP